jgi:hypothetical protein
LNPATIERRFLATMEEESGNALVRNFRDYDAPLRVKVQLALANTWKKVRTRSSCCGNYGMPGC